MQTLKIKSIKNKTVTLGKLWDEHPAVDLESDAEGKEWKRFVDPVRVDTPSGSAYATHMYKTFGKFKQITLSDKTVLRSLDGHRYVKADEGWTFVRNLKEGDRLVTKFGESEIVSIVQEEETNYAYDIQVPGPECYYANGVLSHNSLISNQVAMNQAVIGYKVHFVPLEMATQEMISRSIANISGIDNTKVQLKRLAEAEKELALKKWRRFERRMEKAGGRLTIYKPASDMRIEEIANALHALPSDVIYIDYVSLLKGTDGDDQWRQLGNIARYGKIHAETTNKVVVLLCQVTDDGIIRYSRTMAEHASTSWIFTATRESREKGYLRVDMTKGRNERLLSFNLKVNYATQSATDLSAEELDELAAARANESANKKGRGKSTKKREDSEYLPDLTGDSV